MVKIVNDESCKLISRVSINKKEDRELEVVLNYLESPLGELGD